MAIVPGSGLVAAAATPRTPASGSMLQFRLRILILFATQVIDTGRYSLN